MRNLREAVGFQEVIIKPPADIIVTAQIIQEGIFLRQRKHRIELMFQKLCAVCRNGMPGACHGRDIVQHLTLRFFQSSEVRNDLAGFHNDFAKEKCSRADDIRRHMHQADQGMDLRKVPAVGAELLPDIGHCIEAHDIHAVIAEIQHVCGHVIEDRRVCIIEIPLVRIESRHDDFLRFFIPGEVSRRCCREDFRNRLFVFVRNGPVIIEEVPALIFRISLSCFYRPFMIFAGVIHDEVQTERNAPLMAFLRQRGKILHRAELRIHLSEIRHRVAAVASSFRAFQQRHQMKIVHAAFFNVVKMTADAFDGLRKRIDIH